MNNKYLLTVAFAVALACNLQAGNIDYPVSAIPPELRVHANAVKRFEDIRFEVINLEKVRYYHKVAYTILNENGDKFAQCQETYDILQTVVSMEGRLFDESGKKIKNLRSSDIKDESATSSMNLADDNRVKSHNFYHKTYPYTVEYETEVKLNTTMFYPGWIALENENLSLQEGQMTVSMPEGVQFRYKMFNCKGPVVTGTKSGKDYTWTLKNITAIQKEYASPSWYEISPVVCMAPVQFSIQGYKGNMDTWDDFGKFVGALKDGRDILPENIRSRVHTLTDGISDPYQKIALLYEFMQQNTRYIGVQLGIGGWQPFNASYVATNRYGDCKALSNYMYALLKEAGIRSNYTLVKAGRGRSFLITDFPSQQFNHVIVSVPLKNDTVWLECTSQSLPTGYLSSFTSDRPVLMIDENGGKLARTPRYSMQENLQVRTIKATVNEEGYLSADVTTMYRCLQEDNIHELVNGGTKETILKHLKEQIDLPDYDVSTYDYQEQRSKLPSMTETLKIKAGNYAQVTGKRLFIQPNVLSKTHNRLTPDTNRLFEVEFNYEYRDIDSVEIAIPAGYQPESVPQDAQIESKFGKYSSSIKFMGDKLLYVRSMEQGSGRFPANAYNEMVAYYEKLYQADRRRVVMVKKQ